MNEGVTNDLNDTGPIVLKKPEFVARVYKKRDKYLRLRQGIWVYIMLLIFEGALRRWVLPGLQAPLLIVRDPVAIYLVFESLRLRLLPSNGYLLFMTVIGFFSILTAMVIGHGNILVALYGARTLLFHFPVIFVMGSVLNRDDVIKIGKALLIIAVPMAVLIIIQFFSPATAKINQSIGNLGLAGQITGALGFFRPPGTFSFTTGLSSFFGLVGCFVLYFFLQPKDISKLLLTASAISLLIAIPISISRTLVFQLVFAVIFIVLALSTKPAFLKSILSAILGLVVLVAILYQIPAMQQAILVFTSRFTNASGSEGGVEGTVGNRFLGGLINALFDSKDQPFFGYGIGMGSNVGSQLLTGTRTFLIAEDEWGRIIGEVGPLMGLSIIFLRIGLTIKLLILCFKKLASGDLLPWILISLGIITLPVASWSQPTSLGFCIVIIGLVIASLKSKKILQTNQSSG